MIDLLIYDVAAESGGALEVLNQYYDKSMTATEEKICFVISKLDFMDVNNISVIKLPWVKKSWIHRIYCDCIYMPKLIKKMSPNKVISLQNIGIPRCTAYQTVYVHNAIPFADYKFSLLKEPYLWVYQNIIGKMIYCSLRKADRVIVQADWMRDAVVEKTYISPSRIKVEEVTIPPNKESVRENVEKIIFFYPAQPFQFKNHYVLIEACRMLYKYTHNFELVLTVKVDANKITKKLSQQVKMYNLPVRFVGYLKKEQITQLYRKSILVFPSYLETVGLPLLEAASNGCHIISADCRYARAALKDYNDVVYFKYDNPGELLKLMKECVDNFYEIAGSKDGR